MSLNRGLQCVAGAQCRVQSLLRNQIQGGYQAPTQKGPSLSSKKVGEASLSPPEKGPALQSKLPAGGLDGIFGFQRATS
jgi:hypothetical protein